MKGLFLVMLLGGGFSDDYSVIDLVQALSVDSPAAVLDTRLRWKQEKIQCRYNPAGSPFDQQTVEKAILAAGLAWELKSGLVFEYAGITNEVPQRVVYDCLISWDQFEDLFKQGQTRNFRVNSELVGSDIRLSSLMSRERLLLVLTHELGHGIGLKHDDEGCIMRASPSDKTLCFSDYARVSHLYPPYEVDGKAGLDCTVNLLPDNEVYIPSIDGRFWARYRLNADLSMTHIAHGEINEDELFLCK